MADLVAEEPTELGDAGQQRVSAEAAAPVVELCEGPEQL